jgi:hypothetical protein|nr:MAG TPA: hypothetical protein [Caudoviricetes sp.]
MTFACSILGSGALAIYRHLFIRRFAISTYFCAKLVDKHYNMCYNYIIKKKGGKPMGRRNNKESLINLIVKAVAATAALIAAIAQLIQALK